VNPTEQIAKPAAAPETGRFAPLRGPHRAQGSGASSRGLAAAPFVALELMRASGGRLKQRAVSTLRVIGSEPNLSNNLLALRVGITDENSASQLLARLARRGLLENTRTGGRENVWRLTPSGEELERAIWHETPPAVQRSLALDMLRVRGGRLNHRVVSVLRVIAANPGLSNNDIALRVHIEGKGDASRLLARLARFGLIENTRTGGRENEWQLTPSGIERETAIRDGALAWLRPSRCADPRSVSLPAAVGCGARREHPDRGAQSQRYSPSRLSKTRKTRSSW
jgi:DNA-binding MarR family transcriptional regulator